MLLFCLGLLFYCMDEREFTGNLRCCVCGRLICGFVGELKECDICLYEKEVSAANTGGLRFVAREQRWRRNFAIYGGKPCLRA